MWTLIDRLYDVYITDIVYLLDVLVVIVYVILQLLGLFIIARGLGWVFWGLGGGMQVGGGGAPHHILVMWSLVIYTSKNLQRNIKETCTKYDTVSYKCDYSRQCHVGHMYNIEWMGLVQIVYQRYRSCLNAAIANIAFLVNLFWWLNHTKRRSV